MSQLNKANSTRRQSKIPQLLKLKQLMFIYIKTEENHNAVNKVMKHSEYINSSY